MDAPRAPEAPSTGRLITPVRSSGQALPDFGAQPQVDDTQRAEAWGSREAAGLAPEPAAEGAAAGVGTLLLRDGVHPSAQGVALIVRHLGPVAAQLVERAA